jgi:hypothetical protein
MLQLCRQALRQSEYSRSLRPIFHQFFTSLTVLILSTNYVTKRQPPKLFGEILLDRANFNVMARYSANEANLEMMMNLGRDESNNIQFDAFHILKVSRFFNAAPIAVPAQVPV